MKRFFTLICILGILCVSCTESYDESMVNAPKSTKISKEQALKNLYGELKIIDAETRSGKDARKVKSIKELRGAITRSGNAIADDLLYIVEFEEEQGSAIVAADTRLDPVIAVLDSSVITEEDFASNNTEDISVYMASLISNYADNTISTMNSSVPRPFEPEGIDTLVLYDIAPQLKTKWHQYSPFNDKCVEVYGNDKVAGCWPIALAQFIYHKFLGSTLLINGTSYNINRLSELEYGKPAASTTAKEAAASLLYDIGIGINAKYKSGATSATINDAISFVRNTLRVGGAYQMSYDSSTVFSQLYYGKVIPIQGMRSNGNTGHAWIIDGGNHFEVTGGRIINLDGTVEEQTIVYKKVHCNFGWSGLSDGYYTEGIFDTSAVNYDYEPSIGDRVSSGGGNYNTSITIINH